jgi:hypothetical protein
VCVCLCVRACGYGTDIVNWFSSYVMIGKKYSMIIFLFKHILMDESYIEHVNNLGNEASLCHFI